MVACPSCHKHIPDPQTYGWAACLMWCSMHLDQLNYQTMPLFGLDGLNKKAAKARITSIYNDLMLKSQIATLDLSISQRTKQHDAPGRDYAEKIFAYRDWARLMLRLVKAADGRQDGKA